MAKPFYDYSAIVDRAPLHWPGGKPRRHPLRCAEWPMGSPAHGMPNSQAACHVSNAVFRMI